MNKVVIVFGKEQVNKIHSGYTLTDEEKELNVKEYYFNTESEKNAFIKGIEAAIGWTEFFVLEKENTII